MTKEQKQDHNINNDNSSREGSSRVVLASPDEIAQGKRFADWLRLERAKSNINKAELARRTGVSTSYFTLIETGGIRSDGKYQRPSRQILERIANILRLDPRLVLAAAGNDVPEIQYLPDVESVLESVDGFRDFDADQQEVIREAALFAARNMAQALRKLQDRGVIVTRPVQESDEERQARLREENALYITAERLEGGRKKIRLHDQQVSASKQPRKVAGSGS